ncbi:MAG: colanic acid biosynthesis acetyltransferase WcaF [Phycisphaerales bacterium]|nr:colanic acid biosynthesis acetyltransferase WcaF [Phycisphaerae bacterium]NNF44374.1 colanic acid biosynthesis acetyltransferase WcaF [Phycisphaerales bacterium]NNM24529.1 colanic acid biosynthesis acetyltransferase WcaF [Phycisphaerales bacterium]
MNVRPADAEKPAAEWRRWLWRTIGRPLFPLTPHNAYAMRRFLLRLGGAKLARTAKFRRTVRLDRPWNVRADDLAMLGDGVVVCAVAPIRIGKRCVISQYTKLLTCVRDHRAVGFPLHAAPITIEADCWIATDTLVMPGASLRRGSVVGARGMVQGEIPPWTVAVGEPAVPRHRRELAAPE